MKKILLVMLLGLSGCLGFASKENELIGQVKKMKHQTPLICPHRVDVDISLGVMRNGVGSMSSQDVWLTVNQPGDIALLKKASETGSLVKVIYDVKRVTLCENQEIVTHVEAAQ